MIVWCGATFILEKESTLFTPSKKSGNDQFEIIPFFFFLNVGLPRPPCLFHDTSNDSHHKPLCLSALSSKKNKTTSSIFYFCKNHKFCSISTIFSHQINFVFHRYPENREKIFIWFSMWHFDCVLVLLEIILYRRHWQLIRSKLGFYFSSGIKLDIDVIFLWHTSYWSIVDKTYKKVERNSF